MRARDPHIRANLRSAVRSREPHTLARQRHAHTCGPKVRTNLSQNHVTQLTPQVNFSANSQRKMFGNTLCQTCFQPLFTQHEGVQPLTRRQEVHPVGINRNLVLSHGMGRPSPLGILSLPFSVFSRFKESSWADEDAGATFFSEQLWRQASL